MTPRALWLALAVSLVTGGGLAEHKLEKGVAVAREVPAALKELVQAQGVRVLNDAGAPFVEIWLHKALDAEAKSPAGEVLYPGIPEGGFVGVWRLLAAGSDFRGQSIKPGFYSMRYAQMPADGNHIGAAQYRDFLLLLPGEADQNPAANLKFDEVVALSRKASGTGHPAVFPMVSPESVAEPTLVKNDAGHWVLKAGVLTKSGGDLPVAITVVGRAE